MSARLPEMFRRQEARSEIERVEAGFQMVGKQRHAKKIAGRGANGAFAGFLDSLFEILGFEVAPVSNKLDWRLLATATGFLSVGSLVSIKDSKKWAWFWKVGVGVGGGFDYRFLVAAQLNVLTFNYKMNDRLWVDLGFPSMRFYIETADQARWNAQFIFPLGITFTSK